jgi:hypothetical protein
MPFGDHPNNKGMYVGFQDQHKTHTETHRSFLCRSSLFVSPSVESQRAKGLKGVISLENNTLYTEIDTQIRIRTCRNPYFQMLVIVFRWYNDYLFLFFL